MSGFVYSLINSPGYPDKMSEFVSGFSFFDRQRRLSGHDVRMHVRVDALSGLVDSRGPRSYFSDQPEIN